MFRSLVGFLRKNLPADRPVRVRRTRVPRDVQGDCQQSASCYRIRVDKELGEAHQIDVLLHEYGHSLAYEPEHGVAWGRAYAKVYRTYLGWLEWWDRRPVVLEGVQYRAHRPPVRRAAGTRQRKRRK